MTDSQMDAHMSEQAMPPEPLPCPYCGGEAKAEAYIIDSAVWCCECRSTLMRLNSDYGGYGLSEAIAAWNRRAAPTALATDPAVKALVAEAVAEERERCVMAARLAMVNNPQADEFTCSICAAAIRKRETP